MAEPKQTIDDVGEKRPPATDGSETSENREAGLLDDINEGRLLRKLDFKLLPAVGILYLLSFLDRSNGLFITSIVCRVRADSPEVGNARIEGLAADTGMCSYPTEPERTCIGRYLLTLLRSRKPISHGPDTLVRPLPVTGRIDV